MPSYIFCRTQNIFFSMFFTYKYIFSNSSFFGKRKKKRCSCPIKLVKQFLQEHVLTNSEIFIYRFSEISDRNMKFQSFSFLQENIKLIE